MLESCQLVNCARVRYVHVEFILPAPLKETGADSLNTCITQEEWYHSITPTTREPGSGEFGSELELPASRRPDSSIGFYHARHG
jgi:hypothetical protein